MRWSLSWRADPVAARLADRHYSRQTHGSPQFVPYLSSELILEAVAATRWWFGEAPPGLGMVTFVDPGKVRRKRDPGRCFRRAGFSLVGATKDQGLLAFQILPDEMPLPARPLGQLDLFSA